MLFWKDRNFMSSSLSRFPSAVVFSFSFFSEFSKKMSQIAKFWKQNAFFPCILNITRSGKLLPEFLCKKWEEPRLGSHDSVHTEGMHKAWVFNRHPKRVNIVTMAIRLCYYPMNHPPSIQTWCNSSLVRDTHFSLLFTSCIGSRATAKKGSYILYFMKCHL